MADLAYAEIRLAVAIRADYLCEYCLIGEDDTFFGCQIDHIISRKHGGETAPDNLAYACAFCNRHKGSDLGSLSEKSGALARFFNPRKDRWAGHFKLQGFSIMPLTEIGEVTARILQFNNSERILERQELNKVSRYPNVAAAVRVRA